MDYRYDECGLDNVLLKDLPSCTDDAGDEVVCIPQVNRLHAALLLAVVLKETGLQPKELRFVRTELGMTQAELARVVGKDVQTVGRWERGETAPEQAFEMIIRRLALDRVPTENAPTTEQLAGMTVRSSGERPYVIDAHDPDHYRPLAA